ncbi:MAG: SH3 domain-containing protein, partial [Xenophilus sp.]
MPNPKQTHSLRWLAAGALALALPLAASAQEAYTRSVLNLHAGPGPAYPVVARLAGGQPLNVLGCTGGYAWCDVVLPDGLRGWAVADRLDYAWGGQIVPLVGYGAAIGIPIIGFSLGSYWSDHYRDRPWFGEPRWWGHRPPPAPVPGWRPAPAPPIAWQPRPP